MSLLSQIYSNFETKLVLYFNSGNWKFKMMLWGVIFTIASFFNNITPLFHYKEYFKAVKAHQEYYAYQEIRNRTIDWKKNWVYPPSGLVNRTFRLTMPFFVKVFHLYPVSIVLYAIQLILGCLFFYLLAGYLYKLFGDKITAFYCLIGLATIYVGSAFFIDFSGYSDFFTYFFLFLALYFRNPLYIFAVTEAACWNDERAIAGSGLVLLCWWLIPQLDAKKPFKIEINKQMLAIVVAWLAYIPIRIYLSKVVGLHDTLTPAPGGESDFREQLWIDFSGNIIAYGFKFFWSIEAFWLPILLMFFLMIYLKDYWRFFIVGAAFLLMHILSMTIYDTTRSGSCSYPIIFLSIVFLKNYLTEKELKILFFLVAILCFLHPLATKTKATGMFLM